MIASPSQIEVSIDKLVIVGHDAGTFERTVNDVTFNFLERTGLAPHPYNRYWTCADGSFLKWGNAPNIAPIRYEFNPNVIKPSKENEHRRNVVRLLRTMKYPKVNRIDVAIDVKGVDLSDMTIIDKSSRKQNIWYDGSGRIESRYIGAKESDLKIRIYDKAREQKKENEGHWWRIEAQMRDTWCASCNGQLHVGDNQYIPISPQVIDPFGDVIIKKPRIDSIPKIQVRAMIDYLMRNPTELANLSPHSRYKYKKILADLPSDKELELSKIFESYQEKINKQLDYWLSFSKRNNVI